MGGVTMNERLNSEQVREYTNFLLTDSTLVQYREDSTFDKPETLDKNATMYEKKFTEEEHPSKRKRYNKLSKSRVSKNETKH